jgi:FAD/FMN-containing dehydrogenase/Fe-S oxidoreductase
MLAEVEAVTDFFEALARTSFSGEVTSSEAARFAVATDNSIYQVLPAGVVHPRSTADVVALMRTAATHPRIRLCSRGGGTSTNGQCLTHGLVIDHSRHHDALLNLDVAGRRVTVAPGMVLETLNAQLAAHGLQVAPTLSTASRATIGGMVGTDAAGKGSRVYGKTSEHIESLEVVLADGTVWTSRAMTAAEFAWESERADSVGSLLRRVLAIVEANQSEIAARFPRLTRFLAGYNLARVRQDDGSINLNWLLAGAEGTLAVITAITLRLIPIPAAKRLVVLRYPTFAAALAEARALIARQPQAIETIDELVVDLARQSPLWARINHLLPPGTGPLNLVQFVGDDAAQLEQAAAGLGGIQLTAAGDIAACWDLRKAGVGLLGKLPGARKPVAFIEDTVVPPEQLAAYVGELRALLDRHGLRYGMFGHVDVGCLHVRPALDLSDPEDVAKLRPLSDAVAALTLKYGGLLWGEHGKGFRSEYLPLFVGEQLHQAFRAIKGAFDPHNRLNPGKLVAPCGCDEHPPALDAVPLRGQFDAQIPRATREAWASAVSCNGNGACHAPDPHVVMCPSSKITKDRIHTPKGRAGLVREWLRRVQARGESARHVPAGIGWQSTRDGETFTHEVKAALDGCLACKACSGTCPVQVDVPDLKARFLAHYHSRYARPLRDWAVATVETIAPLAARVPRLANALAAPPGLVDLPRYSEPSLWQRRPPGLASLAEAQVILVPDVFTACFDAEAVSAAITLLATLGWRVHLAPLVANGKPLHILGMLNGWRRTATAWRAHLDRLAASGKPLIALEPAVALSERDELRKAGLADTPRLQLLGEFLAQRFAQRRVPRALPPSPKRTFHLLAHCTEQATAPAAAQAWVAVFKACGHQLTLVPSGCCGMAGVWGHCREHRAESRALFELSWRPRLAEADAHGATVVADGFSCRHQATRFAGRKLPDPAAALLLMAGQ